MGEVDKDQLAQDTGKSSQRLGLGELAARLLRLRRHQGEGSGIVVAKDLVFDGFSQLYWRIAKTAISVRLWIMTKWMRYFSIASLIQDCQMSSLARKILSIGIVKAT